MRIAMVVGGLLAVWASQAGAADWNFDPKVAVSGVYNDNNRMTEVPSQKIEVSGAEVQAEVALKADTPRTAFVLLPRLRSTFYPGDSSEEANDQFVIMTLEQKGERSKTFVNADYSRITTLGQYFPSSTIGSGDQLGNPATGVGTTRITVKNREDRFDVAPGFTFDVGPRGFIDLKAEYLDVGYDRQVEGDQQDYANLMGSIGYGYRTSLTSYVNLRGVFSRYDPKSNADNSTDHYGLDAEWSNRLTATQQIFVRAGGERVQVYATDGSIKWDSGFSGGAGVRWSYEVTDIFFDYNHRLDPSSYGKVVTRDQLRFQLTRKFSPTITAIASARGIKDSGTTSSSSVPGEKWANGTLGFEWRMARQWALAGSYNYNWSHYASATRDAQGNAFSLGVVYEPHRL